MSKKLQKKQPKDSKKTQSKIPFNLLLLFVLAGSAGALLLGIFAPGQWFNFLGAGTPEEETTLVNTQAELAKLITLPAPERAASLTTLAQSKNASHARYLLATDLIAQGQPGAALEWLQDINHSSELAGYKLAKRAKIYELTGTPDQAEKTWQELLQKYPDQPVAAEALYALGKQNPTYWDQALTQFPSHPRTVEIARQRLQQNPQQLDLLLLIAQHGLYLPDYETFLERLTQGYATSLTPENWELIAFGYWEKQQYGKGALAYGRAPRTPENLYRHARGLWLDGKIQQSRQAYEKLITEFPDGGEDTGLGLIRLSRLADPKPAMVYLDRVINSFPSHAAEALLDKSKLLDKQGSKQSASQARQMLLNQYSNSEAAAELRWSLAQQAIKAGNYQVAWQWAHELTEKNVNSELAPQAGFWVGKWAQDLGRSSEAKAAFEAVLANYPGSYFAWRSAVRLGWPVGDFTTVRALSPEVVRPGLRSRLPVGSETLQTLYQLGQDQDAWELWHVEFQNRMKPTVAEQFTDGIMRMGAGDHLDGIWMLSSLTQRSDPEEQAEALKLKEKPDYWKALYPFPYLETIVKWSTARNLNPVLVTALIRQESRFMPKIRSVVGATGLMQVMPETAAESAEKINLTQYNLEDVDDNVNLGTFYLDFTHREYNNNSLLAVASYNAGPGAVAGWIRRFSFEDPDEFAEKIPYPETYGYVHSVFENYWNYLRIYNPQIAELLAKHQGSQK